MYLSDSDADIGRISDVDKIARWCERWCTQCECDLVDFFVGWGWPIDRAAVQQAALPVGATRAYFSDTRWGLVAPALVLSA
jgi:hypothetical protein